MDIEYILHVAMPAIAPNRPEFAGIAVQTETGQQSGVLVADLQTIAIETFNAQRSTILLRTVTRALLKYTAYRVAKAVAAKKKKEADEKRKKGLKAEEIEARKAQIWADGIGDAVNIVNVATEKADTRCWRTLPNRIFLLRMPLSAGTHNLTLFFLDANGKSPTSQTENQPVWVKKGICVSKILSVATCVIYRTNQG